jgi:hypothetical protein
MLLTLVWWMQTAKTLNTLIFNNSKDALSICREFTNFVLEFMHKMRVSSRQIEGHP